MNPIAFVKQHPFMVGGIVLVGVIILVALNAGGGEEVASSGGTASQSDVSGAMQLQALQIQTQAQTTQAAMAKEVAMGEQATTKAIAEINAQIQGQGIDATKLISLEQIGAQKELGILETTLGAKAREAEIAAQLERDRLSAATIQSQQSALVKMAQINKPKQGLFSFLFG